MQIHIRVIAPAFSLGVIAPQIRQSAEVTIKSQGWRISFGDHVLKENDGSVASVKWRAHDIHQGLRDPEVTHLMAVIGGWDSHEILPFIDWELWRRYPKPLIGYSDVTSLQNAAYAKAGVKSIHGPAFSTLGQTTHLEFSIGNLTRCLTGKPYVLHPASFWIDDEWYLDPARARVSYPSAGYVVIQSGSATGVAIGGNLSTFMSLTGTDYFPDLTDKIVFLEDVESISVPTFRRMIQQLVQQERADMVRGVVFGRMQARSEVVEQEIRAVVSRFIPTHVPVLMNASFGHTYPVGSFPIGRRVSVQANSKKTHISFT